MLFRPWQLIRVAAIALISVPCAFGGSQGDEVVVVFNPREHGSEDIARHYAAKRGIPADQIVGLSMPTTELITREEYTDEIQNPIGRFLEDQGLWTMDQTTSEGRKDGEGERRGRVTQSRIRYLVLCRGVPLKIAPDPGLVEQGLDALRPELRRNEAAVDSELACLPFWREGFLKAGPLDNRFYGTTNAEAIRPANGLLMVTRLDGPSVEVAMGLVDKAVQVESNGFWGRAYFDLRKPSEPVLQQGEAWFEAAAETCRLLGFETVLEETGSTFPRGFPMSQIAVYAGWYREHVDGPFLDPEVEFMPGALAYHLHSYSASTVRVPDRHWVGPFLAKGATITLGCVHEPYLAGTPDIGVLVSRLYYLQFSFGEAAYTSQPVSSWMTTVVGDPLFKPMLRSAQELHVELIQRQDPLRAWSQLRLVNLNLAKGFPKEQAVAYLEGIPATKGSAVLSEKLGDLYAELGNLSSAMERWQAAMDLDASPQQRIRLQLRLGEKFTETQQAAQAVDVYRAFLDENPGHPDVAEVCHKLANLCTSLGRTNEAARYQEMSR